MINPFIDFTIKSDDDLFNDLSRIYAMMTHYSRIGNSQITQQLQDLRDKYLMEMHERTERKQYEKAKAMQKEESKIVIDTSDEANVIYSERYKPKPVE